jgi:hypothetical protein
MIHHHGHVRASNGWDKRRRGGRRRRLLLLAVVVLVVHLSLSRAARACT